MSTASLMPHCSYDGNVLILFLDSRKDLVILGEDWDGTHKRAA